MLSLSKATTFMLAYYYTNWMLLDAGPILDPYVLPPPLDPIAVIVVSLLFSCSSAEDFVLVTSIFTSTICTIEPRRDSSLMHRFNCFN